MKPKEWTKATRRNGHAIPQLWIRRSGIYYAQMAIFNPATNRNVTKKICLNKWCYWPGGHLKLNPSGKKTDQNTLAVGFKGTRFRCACGLIYRFVEILRTMQTLKDNTESTLSLPTMTDAPDYYKAAQAKKKCRARLGEDDE